MELQEQIKAYQAWVNSQLKKKSQQITDFGKDLRDGTALITIVEIISGQCLEKLNPRNEEEKKQNVAKVIDFMKSSGIKLPHVTTEEIVGGNVKSMMQLILALAAHFKPASIDGKKGETPTRQGFVSYREKKVASLQLEEKHKEMERSFEKDLSEIESLAIELQKILLLDSEGNLLSGANIEEDLVITRAELNLALEEKLKQEKELTGIQQKYKELSTSNSALLSRLKQQDEDLMLLRQQLLHSNLARDKLKSEKAELSVELDDMKDEMERYQSKYYEKELKCQQLDNQLVLEKTEHIRAMTRKKEEIKELQKQMNCHSPDAVFHDLRIPQSPVLRRSPALSRGSPTLSRKSPVSRNNPPRRRKLSENAQTRILYFTDRDMTPAMATISKRVGDITLGEFKSAIKKQGNYRYIFKALDPELGTVKEEVFRDDDVIPGWEGKIVAWVEEELNV
uniref:Dixin n=1 Tax=Phallusia mammillata TaxID=59560 RepID=A0A6F9DAF5_9ASCI|nr:dixin [Phallusia mammillata]